MSSQGPGRRILCLWLPAWPMQRRTAPHPELDEAVVLLTERTSRGEFVRYGNRFSRTRGIRNGMPLSEALTLVRRRDRLVVEAFQPDEAAQALRELALQCERYSFCVGLEETEQPDSLLMDVSGVAAFFGGEPALARELEQFLAGQRFEGRIAIADTVGAAWGAAQTLARPGEPVVVHDPLPLAPLLPVAALRLGERALDRLARLGISTLAQLLALDRTALQRRLGNELPVRLDQFTGDRSELIVPCRPQPTYEVERHLTEGLTHRESIDALWSQLLETLLARLQSRRMGTRRLKCHFPLEDRTVQTLELRVCEATNDLPHLSDLLQAHLDRLVWDAPMMGARIEALDVAPLETTQPEFFGGGNSDETRQFSRLLNRLGSRLGERAVVVPQLEATPVPERAVRLRPVAERTFSLTPPPSFPLEARFTVVDRPTVLFPRPRPVEIVPLIPNGPPARLSWKGTRFSILRSSRPELVQLGWWDAQSIARDYLWLETEGGQWLWVFRQSEDGNWFWHGGL
ncbi:Y-family DNA polymerase [Planctomyces sp. SH-PL14]|uniref:Y-family DNA polymerase n=1 Tax=Planctomyces sp. SH-PL14 TaxID=1632864 RepID=UPI00094685AC|nr:DNA polymerase Y family protein [Planctomyces sp. SH-PL14]